jgi:hypothetical protein
MRVPPHRTIPVVWILRFLLLLGLVTFGALAVVATRSEAPQTVATAPTVAVALAPPTSAPPRPTQTPQPITSIILRETLVPFPTATPGPANQVSVVDFSYMPGLVRISAGQTVTWRNDGTEQHDVTGSDWHSGPLDPGYTYRLTFGIAGAYPYRCSIHLDMTGTVIVT